MRFVGSLLVSILVWVVALIPLWIFLSIKTLANPQGFWQNFVLSGLGIYVLGAIQTVLLITGLAVTVIVWLQYGDK